jgi:hypothetical protein
MDGRFKTSARKLNPEAFLKGLRAEDAREFQRKRKETVLILITGRRQELHPLC